MSPVSTALEAAGKSVEDAQKALVENTIAALSAEDPAERSAARRLLAGWLFPRSRPVDLDLFRGTRTAEERLARVVAAMGVGGMTPEEAVTASKVVEALSRAGEWERVAAAQAEALRSAGNGPALPVGPEGGPGSASKDVALQPRPSGQVDGPVD